MKYKLKIDLFYADAYFPKENIWEWDDKIKRYKGTPKGNSKGFYISVERDFVENNPAIFEKIPEPIEIEVEIKSIRVNEISTEILLDDTKKVLHDKIYSTTPISFSGRKAKLTIL